MVRKGGMVSLRQIAGTGVLFLLVIEPKVRRDGRLERVQCGERLKSQVVGK